MSQRIADASAMAAIILPLAPETDHPLGFAPLPSQKTMPGLVSFDKVQPLSEHG
jgi:hypothetical protein